MGTGAGTIALLRDVIGRLEVTMVVVVSAMLDCNDKLYGCVCGATGITYNGYC